MSTRQIITMPSLTFCLFRFLTLNACEVKLLSVIKWHYFLVLVSGNGLAQLRPDERNTGCRELPIISL
jgi:hypothetical protein